LAKEKCGETRLPVRAFAAFVRTDLTPQTVQTFCWTGYYTKHKLEYINQDEILMRRQRIIISIASVILVMVGIVVFCRMSTGTVTVKAEPPILLRSNDVSLIEQSVQLSRWNVAQEMLTQHQFKMLFTGCIPDLTLGHVCEIGSLPDRIIEGLPANFYSSCAYAVSRNRFEKQGVRYVLQLTNSNWKVIIVSHEN
jgi:hypothetical protein